MSLAKNRVSEASAVGLLPVFTFSIFLSAFLLFAIQPMFTKMVLPILGGAPGVWSVAMVFFQAALLAGYGYAHMIARLRIRQAALLHVGLMAVACLALPIHLSSLAQNPPSWGEAPWLLGVFAASVGLPFFAVAANGPLLQAWFSRSGHAQARDPYFLYGASNIGSFAALLSYPVLVEPFSTLRNQSYAWTWGFVLLGLAIAGCAILTRRSGSPDIERTRPLSPLPSWGRRATWIGLSAVPSGLLIAVTAHISTDVAAAPLLWVVPLALFLLTFVLVFREKALVSSRSLRLAQLVMTGVVVVLMATSNRSLAVALPAHLILFFVNAMVCHSALYERRPAADRLTMFYFLMSLGGVVGGVLCGLVAPYVFSSILEYPLLLAAALLLGGIGNRKALTASAVAAALILFPFLIGGASSVRSFFGVHKVLPYLDGQFRILAHGTTNHGAMRVQDAQGNPIAGRPQLTTYYTADGPMANAFDSLRAAQGGTIERSFVVGLGAGVMNCLFKDDEKRTFFEIDSAVVKIASDPSLFRFLSECGPRPDIVLGDARLTLQQSPDSASLIVLDAFTSDAIPLHLVTREALQSYDNKLLPGGALIFNLSNKYFALSRILARTAAEAGFTMFVRLDLTDEAPELRLRTKSLIAVLVREDRDAGAIGRAEDGWIRVAVEEDISPWTDDYSNIVAAIRDKYLDVDAKRLSQP